MSQRLALSVATFPFQRRWRNAGGDLSRPNHIHQGTDRALLRSEHPPNAHDTLPTSHAADMKVPSC